MNTEWLTPILIVVLILLAIAKGIDWLRNH